MAEPVEIPLLVDDKASKPLVAVGNAMKDVGDAADTLNKKLDAFDKKTADLGLGQSVSAASEFKAALGGVASEMSSVEAAATLLATGFAAVVTGIGAAVTGIGAAIGSAISFGDALADLQVTTGKTSDELQRLQFEGEQSGLGFEKLLAASKKLEGGIASGSKKVAEGLKNIGVSASDAAGANGIDKVVQALAKIEDPSRRATVSVELFGTKLGTTMAHAATELAAVGDRFTKLGVVVDESIVKAGDQTADAFKLIGTEIRAMVVTFGGAILQSSALQAVFVEIQNALAGLFKWLNTNKGAITEFTDRMVNLGRSFVQALTPAFEAIVAGGGAAMDALSRMRAAFESLPDLAQKGIQFAAIATVLGGPLVVGAAVAAAGIAKLLTPLSALLGLQLGSGIAGIGSALLSLAGAATSAALALGGTLLSGLRAVGAALVVNSANIAASISVLQSWGAAIVSSATALGTMAVSGIRAFVSSIPAAISGLQAMTVAAIENAAAFSGQLVAALGVAAQAVIGFSIGLAAAGAAAFVGWKIGTWIRDLTGLGAVLDGVAIKAGVAFAKLTESSGTANARMRDLAQASTIAGRAITDWGEAQRIVGAKSLAMADAAMKGTLAINSQTKATVASGTALAATAAATAAAAKAAEIFSSKVSEMFNKISGKEAGEQIAVVVAVMERLGPVTSLSSQQLQLLAKQFDTLGEAIKGSAEAMAVFEEVSKRDFAKVLTDQLTASGEALNKISADKAMQTLAVDIQGAGVVTTDLDIKTRALLAVYDQLGKNKAAKEFAAAQKDVADQLLKTGKITQEQYSQIVSGTEKATASTFDFDKALAAANDAMQILGISADSFLGTLIGGLQVAGKAGHDLGAALIAAATSTGGIDFKKLDFGAVISSIAGVIGAFKKATDSASGFKRAIGGALVGVKFGSGVGAALGGIFGGPAGAIIGKSLGAAIGGAAGLIAGIFRKPGWVKAADAAGKEFGFHVSKSLAQEIEKTAKSLKIDFKSASLLHLGDAIAESGKHAREFGGAIGDLMKGIASGAIPATQGIEQLDSAFQAVRMDAEKAAIVGDKVTRSIIAQAKASGQLTDSMKAFLEQQSQLAATGASGLADAFKTLGFATEEQGKAAAGNFIAAFNVALEQDGLVKATDAFRESFATMRDDISKAFGEDFANTALAPIAGLFDLTAEGSPFRGAAQLGDALNQIFTAVANSGQLTADSMTNFGVSAKQAFDAATAGGATVNQALQAQLPFLQSAVSASEQYGLALDANTQGLVDQAKAAGFAFPTDPLVKVVDLLTSIAVKMGAIPAAAATAASGMAALPAAAGAAATQVSASVSAISEEFAGKLPRAVADGADAAAGTVQELGNTMENDLVSAAVSAANGVESALNSIRANTVVVPVVFDQQGGVPEGVTVPGGAEPTTTAPRRRGGRGGGEGFAEGGFIPAVPGGRLIRVAEGGQGEFVIPADKMGSQASVTFNMNVNGSGLNREELTRAMIEAYQTAERGLLRQHQQASRGRR